MSKILIIDDDLEICKVLSSLIHKMKHEADYETTIKNGLNKALTGNYDIILLDVNLPDGNGLDILPQIRQTSLSPEVIILTGFGDPDGAEIAVKNGAWDYIQKGDSIQKIQLPLKRVIRFRKDKKNVSQPAVALKRENIIGNSPAMKTCLDQLAQASITDAPVYLTGETGTGKEVFARAVHENSQQKNKDFIVVDCASLPPNLVEGMLFGHEKGAFTGAATIREGLIKQAHQGTLFLDEIGELPLSTQKIFLRVLQEFRFRPIGGQKEISSCFRLITASNKNLEQMVKMGSFREDLLFRIRSIVIRLPSLKERPDDIKDLTYYYLNNICERFKISTKGISSEFFLAMCSYNWPGNVRELVRALESALTSAGNDPTLYPVHLPVHIRTQLAKDSLGLPYSCNNIRSNYSPPVLCEPFPRFREFMETAEKQYLDKLVLSVNGNVKKASQISGISLSRLYHRIKKYNIQ